MSPRERGQGKTPHHTIRVEDDVWEAFGVAVEQQGELNRTAVLVEFMRWYAHGRGSKMPKRPASPSVVAAED